MYHKATACNVIPDIVEVVNLLQTILSCCNTNADGKIFISYSPLFSFACWPMYKNFRNRTPSQGRIQKIFWTKVWVYYLRYPIFMAGNNGELKMLWFSAKTFYVRPCFLQRFKFREFSFFFANFRVDLFSSNLFNNGWQFFLRKEPHHIAMSNLNPPPRVLGLAGDETVSKYFFSFSY